MSTINELVPLFPSATHPAIPIAAQLLSTLRNLTAPGKGNDLRAEERAALVGIAAMLGCEKVQSKDLPLASAQKASSVSPAHFRSALAVCRKVLATSTSNETSPIKRSPRKQSSTSTSTSTSNSGTGTATGTGTEDETPSASTSTQSPFQTPKKKYKFSSGVDISGLVRTPRSHHTHTHEPTMASPLRHSVTPSTSRIHHHQQHFNVENDNDEEQNGSGIEEVSTPTKKIKFSHHGIDLEHPPPNTSTVKAGTRTRTEDPSSFFALRPGSGVSANNTSTSTVTRKEVDDDVGDDWLMRRPEDIDRRNKRRAYKQDRKNGVKHKKVIRKKDWTYRETVWGSDKPDTVQEQIWENVWKNLPEWLASHGQPSIGDTEMKGDDTTSIILSAFGGNRASEQVAEGARTGQDTN